MELSFICTTMRWDMVVHLTLFFCSLSNPQVWLFWSDCLNSRPLFCRSSHRTVLLKCLANGIQWVFQSLLKKELAVGRKSFELTSKVREGCDQQTYAGFCYTLFPTSSLWAAETHVFNHCAAPGCLLSTSARGLQGLLQLLPAFHRSLAAI